MASARKEIMMFGKQWLLAAGVALALSLSGPSQAQIGSVTAGVAVNQLRTELNQMIGDAQASGEILIYQAGVEAREALNAWERANSKLLDKAFSEFDVAQRTAFNNIEARAKAINSDAEDRIAQAGLLVEDAKQVVASIPTMRRADVYRYTPRVLVPGSSLPIEVRISGVNIGVADPQVVLGGSGKVLPRIELLEQSAKFSLSSEDYNRGDSVSTIPAMITFTENPRAWFGKRRVSRPISLWVLPSAVGSYSVVPTVVTETRVTKDEWISLGEFKGRNKNILKGAKPPEGWKIDLTRAHIFQVQGYGGEAGRCQNVAEHGRSSEGVLVQARVDQITRVRFPGRVEYSDGWVRCRVRLPLYQIVRSTGPAEAMTGQILWGSDVRLQSPVPVQAWTVRVKTMDGRTREFTGAGFDQLFEVRADSTTVTITPRPPKDL